MPIEKLGNSTKFTINFDRLGTTSATWANMPSTATWYKNNTEMYQRLNLSEYSHARISAHVGSVQGASGSYLFLKYLPVSETLTTTVNSWIFMPIVTGSRLFLNATNTRLISDWFPIAPVDGFIGLFGQEGNGSTDPTINNVWVEFK